MKTLKNQAFMHSGESLWHKKGTSKEVPFNINIS